MIPKKVNKMTLEQQEAFLLERLMDLQTKEKVYRRALAQVRGKTKIEVIKYLLGDYNFSGIKAKSDKDKYIIEQISYLISQRRLLQCKKH